MAKKITGSVKLQIPAGKATPAPPVGTALGPQGVNIMEFCKAFNAKTSAKDQEGLIIPVVITIYSDRSFTFITNTPPVPLTADEVNSILYRQASSAERPRPKMSFEKNEQVRINDGPFANFSGKVDEVNPERNTLRVLVTIFGRATPVELDFLQVEKV